MSEDRALVIELPDGLRLYSPRVRFDGDEIVVVEPFVMQTPHAARLAAQRPTPAPTEES